MNSRLYFNIAWPVTADPGVDLELISDFSTEQLIDGNSQFACCRYVSVIFQHESVISV